MIEETRNAVITASRIDMGDRGLLTAWLDLDYGGSGQGFGGHFLFRCMEIAGVEEWGSVTGRTIRVKASHVKVSAIGHIIKDDWFCPADDFSKIKGEAS